MIMASTPAVLTTQTNITPIVRPRNSTICLGACTSNLVIEYPIFVKVPSVTAVRARCSVHGRLVSSFGALLPDAPPSSPSSEHRRSTSDFPQADLCRLPRLDAMSWHDLDLYATCMQMSPPGHHALRDIVDTEDEMAFAATLRPAFFRTWGRMGGTRARSPPFQERSAL